MSLGARVGLVGVFDEKGEGELHLGGESVRNGGTVMLGVVCRIKVK